jgi:hypothetical protein
VYAAASIAVDERQILHNMRHPQPATILFCDDEVAIGLANNSMTPKISNSLDMSEVASTSFSQDPQGLFRAVRAWPAKLD